MPNSMVAGAVLLVQFALQAGASAEDAISPVRPSSIATACAFESVPSPSTPKGLVTGVLASSEQLHGVGSFGRVFSFGKATGWQSQASGVSVLLTALAAPHTQTAQFPLFAVGHDGVILKKPTSDAGWVKQLQRVNAEYPVTWLDALQLNAQRALVVGAYSQYAVTLDGGVQWNSGVLDTELEAHLNDIVRLDDGRLFIAAEAGVQYWSSDEGVSWYADESFPYEGAMFTAQPWGKSGVLVAGLLGHVFVTNGAVEGLRLLEANDSSADTAEDDWSDDEVETEEMDVESVGSWRRLPTATQKSFYASTKLENGDVILAGQAGALFRIDAQTEQVSEIKAGILGTVSGIAAIPDGLVVATNLGIQKLVPTPDSRCSK